MRMSKGLITAASIVALGFSVPALAVDAKAKERDLYSCEGKARVVHQAAKAEGGLVSVPLTVDLRGVRTPDGSAANLAGYLAVVTFDAAQVEFQSAVGGENEHFSSTPVFTNKALANQKGEVKVTSAHTNESGSDGEVNVARLKFRELVPGGASTIKVTFEQAATPLSSLTKKIAQIQLEN